jgi:hypothetical protein
MLNPRMPDLRPRGLVREQNRSKIFRICSQPLRIAGRTSRGIARISRCLQAVASACDLVLRFWEQNVGGSNPLAPTEVSPRGSFPTIPARVAVDRPFRPLGSKRVANGAAGRACARVSAGGGGSEAPPATIEMRGSCAGCGRDVGGCSRGGPKLRRSISFLR